MIIVVDYGSGNLRSVAKALESVGGEVIISQDSQDFARADHLVLPGVGAFADCKHHLEKLQMVEPLLQHIRQGKPFLGICVGMQLLFSESLEFGRHAGLNLIQGTVMPFATDQQDPSAPDRCLKVPHMGWNQVSQCQEHPLWNEIPDHSHFYFVHSFYGQVVDPCVVAGQSDYGTPFTAALAKENIFATQFHPEKSQRHGLQLLHNFMQWRP
jgi:glutamine amidotransferase